jgi:hypothetical protein
VPLLKLSPENVRRWALKSELVRKGRIETSANAGTKPREVGQASGPVSMLYLLLASYSFGYDVYSRMWIYDGMPYIMFEFPVNMVQTGKLSFLSGRHHE